MNVADVAAIVKGGGNGGGTGGGWDIVINEDEDSSSSNYEVVVGDWQKIYDKTLAGEAVLGVVNNVSVNNKASDLDFLYHVNITPGNNLQLRFQHFENNTRYNIFWNSDGTLSN